MLTKLHIKNFRGFEDLEIDPVKRVNLILGENNTGKTGVLEALSLLLSQPPSACVNLSGLFRSRGSDDEFWDWIFFNKNRSRQIEIQTTADGRDFGVMIKKDRVDFSSPQKNERLLNGGQLRGLNIYTTGGQRSAGLNAVQISTWPTSPQQDAINYNRVVLRRKRKDVESLLKKLESRLESIETLQTGKEPLLYADIGLTEMIPIIQMGQGFNRLLHMYSEVIASDAKVLLIDEIENGLHHSVLPIVWKGLSEAVMDRDLQIFATTHSWECVLAAEEAAGASGELNLIRLDRADGKIKATTIDSKALETAKELGWEMR